MGVLHAILVCNHEKPVTLKLNILPRHSINSNWLIYDFTRSIHVPRYLIQTESKHNTV